ncbi:MAG: tyrosine-type recombinase/integrase [Rubricoccaceae bacterium]
MGLLLRSGTFYAEFHDATRTPRAKRSSLRTKDRAEARRRLARLEAAWSAGEFDPWIDNPHTYRRAQTGDEVPLTVRELTAAFVAAKRDAGRSENTLNSYRDVFRLLHRNGCGDLPPARLTRKHVAVLISDTDVRPHTRAKRHRCLRTLIRWSIALGYLRANPLDGIDPPKVPVDLPKALRAPDVDAVCRAVWSDYRAKRRRGVIRCGDLAWRAAQFRLAFVTGLRSSEVARLRWEHVDAERERIAVETQKSGRAGYVPLHAQAAEILVGIASYHADGGLFDGAPFPASGWVVHAPHRRHDARKTRPFVLATSRAFARYRDAAGLPKRFNVHSLRHGHCTALAEAGKSAVVIKESARHSNVSTSMRYVHLADSTLRAELDGVFG